MVCKPIGFFIYICGIVKKKHSMNQELLLIDNMKFMAGTPDKFFDLAIPDPPYGIGAAQGTTQGSKKRFEHLKKSWDNERPTPEYIAEVFRVSKKVIFFGANYYSDLLPPTKNFFIWDKENQRRMFSECELAFVYGEEQGFYTNGRIYRHGTTGKKYSYTKDHPTQKPVDLYRFIFQFYGNGVRKVYDPNSGSGTSARAAHLCGLDYVGNENDEDIFNLSVLRLNQAKAQIKLF